jgi:hypothetical protein
MRWNFCGFIVGPPEYGKTTVARSLVRRHLAELPTGVVFVHDPVGQFGRDGCHWYANAAAWRVAAAKAAKEKKPMPRGAALGGSTEEIMVLARELGERCGNRQENVRVPILVVLDEGSTNDSSGSTWAGKEDVQSLAMRRHRGIGFVFNLQDPMMLTAQLWRLGTDFYLFACTSKHARTLDDRLYLEPGTLERAGICKLDKHRYLHVRQRVGVVSEAL